MEKMVDEWKYCKYKEPIIVEYMQFDASRYKEYGFIMVIHDKFYLKISDTQYVSIADRDYIVRKNNKLFTVNKYDFVKYYDVGNRFDEIEFEEEGERDETEVKDDSDLQE